MFSFISLSFRASLALIKPLFVFSLALSVLTLGGVGGLGGGEAWAQSYNEIEVSLGGSSLFKLGIAAKKLTLTDPTIAEVSVVQDKLLLIGRKVGETNLVAYNDQESETYLIKVTLPARAIQSELGSLFPYERDVRAKAVGGALILEGSVSSVEVVNQIEQVAIGYLKSPSIAALNVKPNVINLLSVKAQQQVQIDVRFAEVNRASLREVGASLKLNEGGSVAGGIIDRSTERIGDFSLRTSAIGFPFEATLNLFAQRSLSRILAEPTLVAMSGERATFLAGGEQPIPIIGSLGVPNVDFKKFGIQLEFIPTVLANQTIELKTEVSISVLDKSQNLTLGGVDLPLFSTRASGTTVRLRSGQSFAIAGLLQDQLENVVDKLPGLGDLPILGMLFNSRKYQRRETELVVLVSARLVNPINGAEVPPLPGEMGSRDPNDVGVFLMNIFEEKLPPHPASGATPRAALPSEGPFSPAGPVGFWR